MTNRDVFGYCDCKVIDSHLHLSQANSADDSITIYKNIFDYFDYERAALMVYQHDIDEKQFAGYYGELRLMKNCEQYKEQIIAELKKPSDEAQYAHRTILFWFYFTRSPWRSPQPAPPQPRGLIL